MKVIEWLERKNPSRKGIKSMSRAEHLTLLHESIPTITESGNWAIAVVGMKGWHHDSAIGDGITSALCALVTRCNTKTEAELLAAMLNDLQPGIMPGSIDIPVYQCRKYDITDYLSQQNQRNGNRKCDRRIV